MSIAIDATLKPHRDLNNAVGSDAGIIGISSFTGGKLWVEDPSGTVKRRISPHVVRTCALLDVCQKAQTFNPRQWHGADQHRGIRATIVGYTTRQLDQLDRDLGEKLQQLGFPLPEVTARYGLATPNRSEDPQPNIADSTAAPCTSTCTQTLADDDDEGCFGEGVRPAGVA